MTTEEDVIVFLEHAGVKGMHWGVRRKLHKDVKENLKNVYNEQQKRQGLKRFTQTLTDEKFKKLSSKDVVIKKGSKINRISKSGVEDINRPHTYVSTNQADAKIYRALVPTFEKGKLFSKHYSDHYEYVYQATKDLKSPSEKKRVEGYKKVLANPVVQLKTGEKITGREYLRRNGLEAEINNKTNHQLALTYYGQLASFQGMDRGNEPISSAYFKELGKQGYNSIVDDNDRLIFGKQPLLIFDNKGALKQMEVRKLSDEEILKAQASIRLPDEDE